MNHHAFTSDIPREVAVRAHEGVSFVPEKRGEQASASYAATLAADYAALLAHAPTDAKRAVLDAEFVRYRAGYQARTLAYLRSKARCVSPMIAGPSRFPVRRMQKRNAVCDRRLQDLGEFRGRALDAIRKALHPEWRPIMAGDADALERLRRKIADLEKQIAVMKAANAAIRRKTQAGREAQIAAVLAVDPLFTPKSVVRLLEPDCMGRVGYAPYVFQNRGAELRRLRSRLGTLERDKATPETILEGNNAVRLEDCPSENRVRLFFPGRPDSSVRTRLKSNGFRWAPSLGCWQAYRNARSLELAKQFVAPSERASAPDGPLSNP